MKVFWGIKIINWLDSFIKNVKDQNNRKSKCIVEKMPHLSSFFTFFQTRAIFSFKIFEFSIYKFISIQTYIYHASITKLVQ